MSVINVTLVATGRRYGQRVHQHLSIDEKSHVYRHIPKTGHQNREKNFVYYW